MTNALDHLKPLLDDFLPLLRELTEGRYAISLGGSIGKGTADDRSDVDLRLFYDEARQGDGTERTRERLRGLIKEWGDRGREVDGYWPRRIADIEAKLDLWLSGEGEPEALVWTIWGYQFLGDIANQVVLEDPDNVIKRWQDRLHPFPTAVKQSLVSRHMKSLRYWRQDYHYANKVKRRDLVFLAGLTARLCQDMIQVLFALNETYYIGDGKNADYLRWFHLVPEGFADRLEGLLYPAGGADGLDWQYRELLALIDLVDNLVKSQGLSVGS